MIRQEKSWLAEFCAIVDRLSVGGPHSLWAFHPSEEEMLPRLWLFEICPSTPPSLCPCLVTTPETFYGTTLAAAFGDTEAMEKRLS